MYLFTDCFFNRDVKKKIDFDSDEDFEVIDIDSQFSAGDESDNCSVFVEDNDDSESDVEESDVKSTTNDDDDDDADFSSAESNDKVVQ